MPAKRESMRQIREVLRQKWALRLSDRWIARSCGLSRPTVAEYVKRAEAAGLSWPSLGELDDAELQRKLFPPQAARTDGRPMPEWALVHRELKRKGVTLALLWDEYKAANPGVAGLAITDLQPLVAPVEIIEGERGDFAGP